MEMYQLLKFQIEVNLFLTYDLSKLTSIVVWYSSLKSVNPSLF